MHVNVYVMIALVCISSLAAAAKKDDPYQRAIDKCVKEVQKELPYSSFDAYLSGDKVKMFGTPESFFKFEKCMDKSGYPVDNIRSIK